MAEKPPLSVLQGEMVEMKKEEKVDKKEKKKKGHKRSHKEKHKCEYNRGRIKKRAPSSWFRIDSG